MYDAYSYKSRCFHHNHIIISYIFIGSQAFREHTCQNSTCIKMSMISSFQIALNPEEDWDKLLRLPPISSIYSSIAMNTPLAKSLTSHRRKEKPVPEPLPLKVSVYKETDKSIPPIPISYDFPGLSYGCRFCLGCPQWKKPQ